MGSKRNKLKKMLSPPSSNQASPQPPSGSAMDDDGLMDELMAQLDSKNSTVQQESANVLNQIHLNQAAQTPSPTPPKTDAKSRYKARQARKAAALMEQTPEGDPAQEARLQAEAKQEEATINRVCDELGLEMYDINPDGHCLFSAIADQLNLLKIIPPSQANFATIRAAAADYIYSHPDDFLPFLPSPGGEDGYGSTSAGLMTLPEFQRYCSDIRNTGAWGGEPEILALARVFNVPIHVVQGGNPPVVVHNPVGAPVAGDITEKGVVRISYHRRMYGLGEHYNSLRPKSKMTRISDTFDSLLGH
ncbi:hypothetical protein JAAARDRAFT_31869 [Jaapia argillacea MUCL 33604]|uniref:OTU domain-containing protein n=1 Tax=Jaapia argillacea MUCL 33604 TaxID=933084 RepID=A0A067QBH9_9AGAM|nr:hypothetical protein JAAARDRAFT_31869 [Jaapia argillacea MUCL 33604]